MNTSCKRKIFAAVIAFTMLIAILPTNCFAVTGDHIAADGAYTSQLQGYKKGKAESGYTSTLNVTISEGYITSIFITNIKKDKITKAFNASGYQDFLSLRS